MAISVRTHTKFGSSPQSITTQTGDKALAVMYSGWDGPDVTAVSFNSVAFTQAAEDIDGATGETSSVWYLLNPSIATANVTFTQSLTPDDGPGLTVFIVACDGTISFVDAGADGSDPTTTTTENCAVGDLALAMGGAFGGAASVGGGYVAGDALSVDSTFNGQHIRPYARVIASGTTTQATSQLTVGQIVFRETGGASPSVNNDTSVSRNSRRTLTGVGLQPRAKPVRRGAIWAFP